MAMRLREMIRAVRGCKTLAEERAVISKECANIRSSFTHEESEYRQRNVAKLLFIHMLGYPTHFGQMECLKLIVSPHYSDKRIGYLGLMLLLDERQEVLMLVTNSLKMDLNNQQNQYVVGLALCALANIASPGIARDLTPDVEKLLSSPNHYVRKKAALCAVRIVRKVPELQENFLSKVKSLLSEKNHGVLVTGVALLIELCEMDYNNIEQFRKPLVPNLVRLLKTLVGGGYAPEYDVGGITDPFLQVKILKLLRLLGNGDQEASEQMNDILAQVATNTENMRNVGNAILYECVSTIMNIESESGLRVLAINILGRFLGNRDNNIRYVALNTLSKVVASDAQAVQRHRNTIVDCLKDNDVSIRKRALDLIYALVNEANVKVLVRELINFLIIADVEFKSDLTAKLCMATEKYAPTKKWHVDTVLRIMSISGAYIPEEVCSTLITLIAQSPELQAYAVQKMYLAISKDYIQQSLIQVASWTIGEYGDLLVSEQPQLEKEDEPVKVSEAQVIDLLEMVLKAVTTTDLSKCWILTAIAKLADRFGGNHLEKIHFLLDHYSTHINPEIQQRAIEYVHLIDISKNKLDLRRYVLERVPAVDVVVNEAGEQATPQARAQPASGSLLDTASGPVNTNGPTNPVNGAADIMSLLSLGPSTPTPNANPASAAPANILDIFSTPATTAPTYNTPKTTPGAPASNPILDLVSLVSSPASTSNSHIAYNKNGILIQIETPAGSQNPVTLNVTITNSTATAVNDFNFQLAVPKYCKLTMKPPSGKTIAPNNTGQITQQVVIDNTMYGQKPIVLRLKIEGKNGDQPFVDTGDVPNLALN